MYLKRNKVLDILKLYLRGYKKQLYLREISKLARLPVKTTQNLTKALEEERVFKSQISGKNKYFRLNLDNLQTKFYLLSAEIYKTSLFIEKYPSFNTFLKGIKTNSPLIVFGSFAKFEADQNSDLDLLIIEKNADLPFHLLAPGVHKMELSKSEFIKSLEKEEPLIMEIKENHVILNNHSFYIDAMWEYYEK